MIDAVLTRELAGALDALDEVVGARLAERARIRGADPAPAPAGETPDLPALERYGSNGPLALILSAGELTPAEALVLVAAIAPEVDPRYDSLYASINDRQDRPWLTGEVARTLAAPGLAASLAFPVLLAEQSRLLRAGLLTMDAGTDSELSGRIRPDPDVIRWVLARPPLAASVSDLPAQPVATVHRLDDVVAAQRHRQHLVELIDRIRNRARVVDGWGFSETHDGVRGVLALFHGPPGTGKTMAAAVIGQEVGMPVWRVDLSTLASKYIGDGMKQCRRIFDRAAREGWLLVFDEADAVFGKRTEIGDAHDRYANQEVSYLLSRVESHPGVVILTTNLLANIDAAFLRRIHSVIDFQPPGPHERATLWSRIIPEKVPIDPGIDRTALALRYDLTAAQIKDAALDAAYFAAAAGDIVREAHLLAAVERQYEKAGRTAPTV